MKLKKGDKVIVISGKDKGSIGTIQKVFPKENRVIVDGVNVCKKHVKPNQMNPEGSIQEIFAPIDASNVLMLPYKAFGLYWLLYFCCLRLMSKSLSSKKKCTFTPRLLR